MPALLRAEPDDEPPAHEPAADAGEGFQSSVQEKVKNGLFSTVIDHGIQIIILSDSVEQDARLFRTEPCRSSTLILACASVANPVRSHGLLPGRTSCSAPPSSPDTTFPFVTVVLQPLSS